MRFGIIFIVVFLASGCAVQNKFQMYETVPRSPYPSVSLIVNDGYVYSNTSCSQYGCNTYVDRTHLYALNYLRDNSTFERVDINNPYAEYKILMSFSRRGLDSRWWLFTKLMVSGCTLFLAPITYETVYASEFAVMHRDKVIATYSYDRSAKEVSFLLYDPKSHKLNAVHSIVSNFLRDVDRDGVFEGNSQYSDVSHYIDE